ncbi:PTS transporter subunit EIIC [Collinsella sp. AGMB00827]|uniref:PTS transporter subunit EIIC n=1 Tax=Collinsella ureilytica TaxID=2869515 RepID=A0ABS7MMV4_9ACTN|nr:PTS transporter subunit EIIC [Collinsella urealyticum]MBY4798368.1 PTS transporter subunit EIIC [Collinsella urealyticum]
MKRDWKKMAEEILAAAGGKENLSGMTHCATRLRLNVKDAALVDDAAVKAVDGVINTVSKAGQYQVLIGTEVPKLYEEFELVAGVASEEAAGSSDSGEGVVSKIFSAVSGIFAPLLPAMAGSGILRGLLILAVQLGVVAEGSGTFVIWNTLSMSVFYFLPVLLAFSAGRRFGASPYLSALIGACLLFPDFMKLMGDVGNGAMTDFFGIPVVLMGYNSTVVPAILAIWVYSYLYKFLDARIPETLKLVVLPAVSLFVMVPLTIMVIGPLGVYVGEGIAFVVNWLINKSAVLAGVLVGGGWSVLVSMGIHWAVNPIMINNIAQNGFDYICPFTFACNFAVIGVAAGVFFKVKSKRYKSFAMSGVVTIALSAIIEPTLFGMLVNNKKLFAAQIIAGACGGAFLGLMKVVATAFVFGSVTTFPAFVSQDAANFGFAMAGLAISTVVGAVLGYLFTNAEDKLA